MSYLMLPYVEMVHIQQRDCVTVLIIIKIPPDLVEEKLDIELGDILVRLIVHFYLRKRSAAIPCNKMNATHPALAGNGFENELVVRKVFAMGDLMKTQ